MNVAAEQGSVLKNRRRRDTTARVIISGFGGLVLLTMVILIWHLFSQAASIALSPDAKIQTEVPVLPSGRFLYVGDMDSGQAAIVEGPGCRLSLARIESNTLSASQSIRRPCSHTLTSLQVQGLPYAVDISASGQVRLLPVPTVGTAQVVVSFSNPLASELSFAIPESVWESRVNWQLSVGEQWLIMVVKNAESQLIQWVNRQDPARIIRHTLPGSAKVVLLPDSKQVAEIKNNVLVFYNEKLEPLNQITLNKPVETIFTFVKNRSLFVAHSDNTVSRYTVYNDKGTLKYQLAYGLTLRDKEQPVAIYPHASVNGLAVITNQQQLLLINRVSGEIVERRKLPFQPTGVSWFDNRVYVFSDAVMSKLRVEHMAGLSTAESLLTEQLYEGYREPDQLWQTTSATDYQETKMNLMPLLIGSFKASGLALLIAIPLALGAAVYTAYFARPKVRDNMKPAIEMLEAIPSVLIGFIAAIWLAPLAERFLFSFAVFLFTVPFSLLLIAFIQHKVARNLPSRVRNVAELVLPVLGIVALGYISIEWAPQLLFYILEVNDFDFITDATGVPVGKTTILVAIALGFAISPSIYSLAEDAISGVPASLRQASYALGATRLQTLRRVVLRVAFPGIMAAVMLGFGRAFGETMIVLMVTGNTPIADWDLFAGLRALTANLAIELPEAELNSMHYKVLFLTACVLFTFTFVVNTLAELLRQRLRRNASYG